MRKFILASAIMTTIGAITTVVALQTPLALAQGQGPPSVHIGNPHDFRPDPLIPNCSALDQGNFHGPPNDPTVGCKIIP